MELTNGWFRHCGWPHVRITFVTLSKQGLFYVTEPVVTQIVLKTRQLPEPEIYPARRHYLEIVQVFSTRRSTKQPLGVGREGFVSGVCCVTLGKLMVQPLTHIALCHL